MSNLEIQLAVLGEQLKSFIDKLKTAEEKIDGFDEKFESKFITKEEFKPVKMLVYGFAGLIFSGFVLALITLVIK